MRDKVFIDTNIWVYLYVDNSKTKIAKKFVESNIQNIIINTRALNEFFNVISQKLKIKSKKETEVLIQNFIRNFSISIIDTSVISRAINISIQYQLNCFDSLMLSSALSENCGIFYSEDLTHGQIIDDTITIINPFK
jgi:predicted nucleic acid-binding protein